MITYSWKMINGHVPSFERWGNIFWKLFKQLSLTNRLCQFIFSAKSGTRFKPGAAELFVSIFQLELELLTQYPASYEWNEKKKILFMKNRHLPNWIIWLTEQIPKYMLQICVVFSFNTLKFAWKLINTVLAGQGLIIFYKKSPCIMKMLIKMSLYKEVKGGGEVVKYFYVEFQVGPTCYISLFSIRIIAKVNLNFSNYCIALLLHVRQDLLLLFQFYEPMPGPSLPRVIDMIILIISPAAKSLILL